MRHQHTFCIKKDIVMPLEHTFRVAPRSGCIGFDTAVDGVYPGGFDAEMIRRYLSSFLDIVILRIQGPDSPPEELSRVSAAMFGERAWFRPPEGFDAIRFEIVRLPPPGVITVREREHPSVPWRWSTIEASDPYEVTVILFVS